MITQLLNEVENQQVDIKDLLDESQNIRLKLTQLREDISSALAKNSLLIEGKVRKISNHYVCTIQICLGSMIM